MFKHIDKADLRLSEEDLKAFKEAQAKSYKQHMSLCKFAVAAKIKKKQK